MARFDKVMVLESGRVVQFDSPAKLVSEEGLFRELAMKNGEKYFQKIEKIIREVHQ